jgi:hypothetical protein
MYKHPGQLHARGTDVVVHTLTSEAAVMLWCAGEAVWRRGAHMRVCGCYGFNRDATRVRWKCSTANMRRCYAVIVFSWLSAMPPGAKVIQHRWQTTDALG